MKKYHKLTTDQVNEIHNVLSTKNHKTCSLVAKDLSFVAHPKLISDINRGHSYNNPLLEYPLNSLCIKTTSVGCKCVICGEPVKSRWSDGKGYCSRHYMNLYRYGEVLDRPSIYDRNDFIDLGNGVTEIILRDVYGSELRRAIVDSDLVGSIREVKWYLHNQCKGYVHGSLSGGMKVRLHRHLTNAPKHSVVDHINGDTMDNRLENLRVVSQKENAENNRYGTVKGVRSYYSKKTNSLRWAAMITNNYKPIWLGVFDTREEAIAARLAGEEKYFTPIVSFAQSQK